MIKFIQIGADATGPFSFYDTEDAVFVKITNVSIFKNVQHFMEICSKSQISVERKGILHALIPDEFRAERSEDLDKLQAILDLAKERVLQAEEKLDMWGIIRKERAIMLQYIQSIINDER
jgi:hypothetical protein